MYFCYLSKAKNVSMKVDKPISERGKASGEARFSVKSFNQVELNKVQLCELFYLDHQVLERAPRGND